MQNIRARAGGGECHLFWRTLYSGGRASRNLGVGGADPRRLQHPTYKSPAAAAVRPAGRDSIRFMAGRAV